MALSIASFAAQTAHDLTFVLWAWEEIVKQMRMFRRGAMAAMLFYLVCDPKNPSGMSLGVERKPCAFTQLPAFSAQRGDLVGAQTFGHLTAMAIEVQRECTELGALGVDRQCDGLWCCIGIHGSLVAMLGIALFHQVAD